MSCSVYPWPPTSAADACAHEPELVHVLASTVVAVFAVVSVSFAVAQSYETLSGQCTLYQNESVPPVAGAAGLKEMVVPAGTPEAVMATVCAVFEIWVVITVPGALVPCTMLNTDEPQRVVVQAGFRAVKVKSGAGVTVTSRTAPAFAP